jgi:FkbM family methyltransferase
MLKRWRAWRFDLVEVVMIAAIVGLVAYIASPTPAPAPADEERDALEKAYGSARNSENEEEWIIRDFFKDRRGGVFVDVGAAHYKSASNTYYLEHELGWSGIAIEPLRHFEADWVQHRPRTRFRPFFVSDVSDGSVKLYTYGEKFAASSSDRTWVERFGDNPREVSTLTITLDDLLNREKIETFDFLSMDIELAEPKALAGFDIERFRPSLVCIEAHPEVRQQILDYFARHNYVVIGKYLRADEKNLYFAPRTSAP